MDPTVVVVTKSAGGRRTEEGINKTNIVPAFNLVRNTVPVTLAEGGRGERGGTSHGQNLGRYLGSAAPVWQAGVEPKILYSSHSSHSSHRTTENKIQMGEKPETGSNSLEPAPSVFA